MLILINIIFRFYNCWEVAESFPVSCGCVAKQMAPRKKIITKKMQTDVGGGSDSLLIVRKETKVSLIMGHFWEFLFLNLVNFCLLSVLNCEENIMKHRWVTIFFNFSSEKNLLGWVVAPLKQQDSHKNCRFNPRALQCALSQISLSCCKTNKH